MEKFMPFLKAAVDLVSKYEIEIRDAYKNTKNKSSATKRDQVIKHKLGDLWGLSISLKKSLESLATSKASKLEIQADFESQIRNTFDCLSAFEKYNREEFKSEAFTKEISEVYSLINSNDIKELSASAVLYLEELS